MVKQLNREHMAMVNIHLFIRIWVMYIIIA